MHCRKCIKQAKGKTKVIMKSDLDAQLYLCPECGYSIDWNKDKDTNMFSNHV